MSLNDGYQVYFQLKNSQGEVKGETLSMASNNDDVTDARIFEWADVRTIGVGDVEEDVMLHMTVQTEQVGITKGKPIATGQVNLNEVLYIKKDAKGSSKGGCKVKMELVGLDGASELVVNLKFTPVEKAPVAEAEPVQELEETKNNYAIPNEEDEEENSQEKNAEDEEKDAEDEEKDDERADEDEEEDPRDEDDEDL